MVTPRAMNYYLLDYKKYQKLKLPAEPAPRKGKGVRAPATQTLFSK